VHVLLLPGLKWKVSPKEDFYQEVLDLLGGLSTAVKQQQQDLIKAVMAPGAAGQEEEQAADYEGQEDAAAVVA
jgi:Rab-like protein 2